jgi:PTS system nitrogen regulatory IIA component
MQFRAIGGTLAEPSQDISVKEAAEFLRVSEKTIYRWIQQGVVPAYRAQGQYRFNRRELEGWARYKRIGAGFGGPALQEGDEPIDLAEAIQRGGVHYKVEGGTPEQIFRKIVEIFPPAPPRDPAFKDDLARTLIEREALASTGIGKGLSIPHPRHPRQWGLDGPAVGVFFLEHPADFKAFDGEPVYVLFVLLCATVKGHLQMLAQVSHLLREPETQALLRRVPTRSELLEQISKLLHP